MKRRLLEIILGMSAIAAPLAFWRLQVRGSGEKLLVLNEKSVVMMFIQIFFFYITPSFPFIVLTYLCKQHKSNQIPRHNTNPLIGATLGAIFGVGIPYLLLRYSDGWQGNIGAGILLMAIPLCLLTLMSLGWYVGQKFGQYTNL